MRKKILLSLALFFLVFFVSACGIKKVDLAPVIDPSVVQDVTPLEKGTSTEEATNKTAANEAAKETEAMNCGGDQTCFLSAFLECKPAEFKIVSPAGESQISVIGLAGDRCYYLGGVYQNGVLINSGKECRVPLNLLSRDAFNHFFGQDNTAGKEAIKLEQDRIESDYCSQI